MSFSEKAAKIWRNLPLTLDVNKLLWWEMFSNFVAFSEYMNFTKLNATLGTVWPHCVNMCILHSICGFASMFFLYPYRTSCDWWQSLFSLREGGKIEGPRRLFLCKFKSMHCGIQFWLLYLFLWHIHQYLKNLFATNI